MDNNIIMYRIEANDHSPKRFLGGLPPRRFLGEVSVSPNGKWMAFMLDDEFLILANSAEELMTIPRNTTRWGTPILGWLTDSQRLLIPAIGQGDRYDKHSGVPNSVIVFNPFTQQQEEIALSLPYETPVANWYWGGNVLYDPTLSRVVYLENISTMILWDIVNGQELWRTTGIALDHLAPKWSPDGALLAFLDLDTNGDSQLSLVSRDGENVVSVAMSKLWVYTLVWSPDGRYLAYWTSGSEERALRLFVFDVDMKRNVDTCIIHVEDGSWPPVPIWSPNSEQFIVRVPSRPRSSPSVPITGPALVVDIVANEVLQLDVELNPLGWLTHEP